MLKVFFPTSQKPTHAPLSCATSQSNAPAIKFQTKAFRKQPVLLPSATPIQILKQANDWEFLKNTVQLYCLHTSWKLQNDQISLSTQTQSRQYSTHRTDSAIERNLVDANLRKKCKYSELVAECENHSWTTHYFPVEIGSLSALRIPKGKKKKIMDHVAQTALRGSYAIWLSRNSKLKTLSSD